MLQVSSETTSATKLAQTEQESGIITTRENEENPKPIPVKEERSRSITQEIEEKYYKSYKPKEPESEETVPKEEPRSIASSQEKYNKLESTLKREQQRYKQLQTEFEICQQRELSAQMELGELRDHLEKIKTSYTIDAMKTEEQTKYLQDKLQQVVEMNRSSASSFSCSCFSECPELTALKSSPALYRFERLPDAEQVRSLRLQAELISQKREDVQGLIVAAEDEVARQAATIRHLQGVLERLKRQEAEDNRCQDEKGLKEEKQAIAAPKKEAEKKRQEETVEEEQADIENGDNLTG